MISPTCRSGDCSAGRGAPSSTADRRTDGPHCEIDCWHCRPMTDTSTWWSSRISTPITSAGALTFSPLVRRKSGPADRRGLVQRMLPPARPGVERDAQPRPGAEAGVFGIDLISSGLPCAARARRPARRPWVRTSCCHPRSPPWNHGARPIPLLVDGLAPSLMALSGAHWSSRYLAPLTRRLDQRRSRATMEPIVLYASAGWLPESSSGAEDQLCDLTLMQGRVDFVPEPIRFFIGQRS